MKIRSVFSLFAALFMLISAFADRLVPGNVPQQPTDPAETAVSAPFGQTEGADENALPSAETELLITETESEQNGARPASAESVVVSAIEKNAVEAALSAGKPEVFPLTGMYSRPIEANENVVFEYTVRRRGYLSLIASTTDLEADFAGEGTLVVSLLQRYSSTGGAENDSVRFLTCVMYEADTIPQNGNSAGVEAGEYVVVITAVGAGISKPAVRVDFVQDASYEVEPNDAFTRYTRILPGVPIKGSSGSKALPDEDCFLFVSDSPGYAVFSFEHPKLALPSVTWLVSLCSSDGTVLYNKSVRGSDGSFVSPMVGIGAGEFFITVRSHVYCPDDYTINLNLTASDCFETEPNDGAELAYVLEPGVAVGASMSERSGGADRDFFVLRAGSAGGISVSFASEYGGTDIDSRRLTLTDSSGTVLFREVISGGTRRFDTPVIGVPAGDYYIVVDNEGLRLDTAVYTIEADFDDSKAYEKEPNDSVGTATELSRAAAVTGSLTRLDAQTDVDYYRIELSKPCDLKVRFSQERGAGDNEVFRLTLTDSSGEPLVPILADGSRLTDSFGTELTYFSVAASESEREHVWYSLEAGTYYVRVGSGTFFSDSAYSISYTF
ncbi:MAG: hypothetical protein K6C36_00485 [Clostridia bacterium]|nr:hypothetical protein [Clostridia bacterium]